MVKCQPIERVEATCLADVLSKEGGRGVHEVCAQQVHVTAWWLPAEKRNRIKLFSIFPRTEYQILKMYRILTWLEKGQPSGYLQTEAREECSSCQR